MERNAPSTSPVRRCEGTLDSAPFRLIARHLRASYEWYAHAPLAVEAGVPAAAIEAIRTGATPSFAATDQVLVHRVVTELIDTKWLADTHLAEASSRFGEQGIVELGTILPLAASRPMANTGLPVDPASSCPSGCSHASSAVCSWRG
jgi:hypothetical protein